MDVSGLPSIGAHAPRTPSVPKVAPVEALEPAPDEATSAAPERPKPAPRAEEPTPLASDSIDTLIESVRGYRAGFPPDAFRPAAPEGDRAPPAAEADRTAPVAETDRAAPAEDPHEHDRVREEPEGPARAAGPSRGLPTGTLPGDDAGSILDVTG